LALEMPDTFLDKSQITQVFVNILLNAIEAIGEQGSILVRSYTSRNQKEVIIEISDSGSGISPENLPKIFDPFFSSKPGGTGLGLAVSYGIIQRHHGQIHAFSRPRKGARFVIEIPIDKDIPNRDTVEHGNTIS